MATLLGKSFECVVGKCFVVFCVFSFPPAVYVGTFLIASFPGPSILTSKGHSNFRSTMTYFRLLLENGLSRHDIIIIISVL